MSSVTATADRLFSQLVRARGACERCGSSRDLEAAHIVPRMYKQTRWVEPNCLCLCARCHRFFHSHPQKFRAWVGQDRWRSLWFAATKIAPHVDASEVVRALRAQLKESA